MHNLSFIYTIKLSIRAFKTRTMRTVLTILGIGVGIGAIVVLVGLGYGLQNTLLERITTSEALLSLNVFPGEEELLQLNESTVRAIGNFPNVEYIAGVKSFASQVQYKEIQSDTLVNIAPTKYFNMAAITTKWGEIYKDDSAREVVVSEAFLRLFDITDPESAIEKNVSFFLFVPSQAEEYFEVIDIIELEEYKIVGVIEDNVTNYVFLPPDTLPHGFAISEYDNIRIKVTSDEALIDVKTSIIGLGFIVSSLSDTIEQANKIFAAIKIILAIFGVVALVVASIGMFNTMTVTLLERTHEIGVMKSIGASQKDIKRLFLTESTIMGFLGGISGIGIGYLLAFVLNFGFNTLARMLGGEAVDLFYFPMWFIVTIAIFSIVVGILTGLWPAERAARINALSALRYK